MPGIQTHRDETAKWHTGGLTEKTLDPRVSSGTLKDGVPLTHQDYRWKGIFRKDSQNGKNVLMQWKKRNICPYNKRARILSFTFIFASKCKVRKLIARKTMSCFFSSTKITTFDKITWNYVRCGLSISYKQGRVNEYMYLFSLKEEAF